LTHGLAARRNRHGLPASRSCRRDELAACARVRNGRSFALDDGREIRLPGIEVPPLPRPGEAGVRADAGLAARAALAAMLAGQTVELRRSAPLADRYGRTLAHAWIVGAGPPRSAAHEMLGQGFARVSAQVGNVACASELLAREARARAARLGLWGEAYYAVVGAESLPDLLAERGRFTVVEGRVATVRERAEASSTSISGGDGRRR